MKLSKQRPVKTTLAKVYIVNQRLTVNAIQRLILLFEEEL